MSAPGLPSSASAGEHAARRRPDNTAAPQLPAALERLLSPLLALPDYSKTLAAAQGWGLKRVDGRSFEHGPTRELLLRAMRAWGPACLDWVLPANNTQFPLLTAACWCAGWEQCECAAPCPLVWLRHLPHSAWVVGERHLNAPSQPRVAADWLVELQPTGHWPLDTHPHGPFPAWLERLTAGVHQWVTFCKHFRAGDTLPVALQPQATVALPRVAGAQSAGTPATSAAQPPVAANASTAALGSGLDMYLADRTKQTSLWDRCAPRTQ